MKFDLEDLRWCSGAGQPVSDPTTWMPQPCPECKRPITQASGKVPRHYRPDEQ